uniref:E2F/DP family winged-helix DNA-binding domain-containing protein n=1 Tax=Cyclopterus lumpus TaxID=8103 RepID=A0A8C3AXX0_CYCLU
MDPEGSPHSPDADQIPKYQRSLRSLHMLATRFVRLLQEAEGGLLDLKDAVRVLAVRQKRRIYDITNVLEGVGLIVKISKSILYKLMMAPASPLRLTLWHLVHVEAKRTTNISPYLWQVMTRINCLKEFSLLSSGHTLLAVQAPCGTQLDVPIPKAVSSASIEPYFFFFFFVAFFNADVMIWSVHTSSFRSRTAQQSTRSI